MAGFMGPIGSRWLLAVVAVSVFAIIVIAMCHEDRKNRLATEASDWLTRSSCRLNGAGCSDLDAESSVRSANLITVSCRRVPSRSGP